MPSEAFVLHPVSAHDVFHTTRDCPQLGKSERELFEVSQRRVEWHGLRECPKCDVRSDDDDDPGPLEPPELDPGPLDADALRAARRRSQRIADEMDASDDRPLAGAENRGGYRLNGGEADV